MGGGDPDRRPARSDSGGADKAALEHDGRTLLEHALDAVADAAETVVVGPDVPTPRPVTFARESPAGGGPLAGLARRGRRARPGRHERVVVLAVDMPHVGAGTVARLLDAAEGADAAWLTDDDGRRQLAGRRTAVRWSRVREDADGAADAHR